MKTVKQVLRPERVRSTPEQFSWVDQALVQHHLIDRCSSHSAALYLFLVTVADCEGLSYYGASTLAGRLHLSEAELAAARTQLMALDLIAWQPPLYQVLTLPGKRAPEYSPASPASPASPTVPMAQATMTAPSRPRPARPAPPPASARPTTPAPNVQARSPFLSLTQLLDLERHHAQL
jgi:hypothetical protein